MSVQGRSNHPSAYLDWAWWNGLVGLIMTIICFFSLFFLILDMMVSSRNKEYAITKLVENSLQFSNQIYKLYFYFYLRKFKQKNVGTGPPAYPLAMAAAMPPFMPPTDFPVQPYNYPNYNDYVPPNFNDYPIQNFNDYPPQDYSNDFFQSPPLAYGNQPPLGPYMNSPSPSPMITDLARQYVTNMSDAQYERELLEPYQQYFQDPYYY